MAPSQKQKIIEPFSAIGYIMNKFFKTKLFGITIIGGIAKLSGLIRDVLFAASYGTGELAAAYESASKIPMSIFDILFGCAIGCSFIPIICAARSEEGEEGSKEFADSFAGIILFFSLSVTILGMMFSQTILSFFTEGLSAGAKGYARTLLIMLFPTLFINSFSFLLIALFHSKGSFILPAIISLATNALSIIYLLRPVFGIIGLASVSVFGGAIQLMMLYFYAKRSGYTCRPTLRTKDKYIKSSLILTLQGLLPCILTPIINLISMSYSDRYMSGRGITVFSYANRIFMMCGGFFAFAFSSFLLPILSKEEAEGDSEGSRKSFSRYSIALMIILIPVTVAVGVFPKEIINLIFGRGNFTLEDVSVCAGILRILSVGIPFFALSELSVKAYFAKQKCIFPSVCAALSLIFFSLGLKFSPFESEMTTLPFASSCAYILYAVILIAGLKLKPIKLNCIQGGKCSND